MAVGARVADPNDWARVRHRERGAPRISRVHTIAVIPARAGSRAIPGKNLRLVGGRSLLARSIEVARAVPEIDRVIVSSDSPRIISAARRAGAEAPFRRPAHLSGDEAPTIEVIRHAVTFLELEGRRVDVVVTLQPTSPFCTPASVRMALGHLADPAVDSATTVADVGLPASIVGTLEQGRFVALGSPGDDARRQASPSLARLTGAVYVTRRALLDHGRLLGERPASVMTAGPEALDIDTPADLAEARRLQGRRTRPR